ncbi:hypothetical protein M8818_006106 [Zalaria obscura]|uniref:Uncharacterized protein n=1 Tax=Zalaria obscura TaxID=2024903 RepID=A0ACC3S6Y4_9PEZI
MAPLLSFVKPRVPVRSTAASTPRPIDLGFLTTKVFWVLQIFNIAQGTGYFLPPNYLPTFAQSIGLSSTLGSLTLVMMNAASTMGCVGVGTLVDRADVTTVLLGISVGATISILAAWGLAVSIAPLCVFAVLYGLTAGSYSTAWTGMIKPIQTRSSGADANLVFGFLAAGRGLGAVLSGPLSEALIDLNRGSDTGAQSEYGGPYGRLVVYAGCTAFCGGLSWAFRRVHVI